MLLVGKRAAVLTFKAAQIVFNYINELHLDHLTFASKHSMRLSPSASASAGGTALPIWRAISTLLPENEKSMGKVCNKAPSSRLMVRIASDDRTGLA